MNAATRTAVGLLLDELACTTCHGVGCDGCDHTGQQTCEHVGPRQPTTEACREPRPCAVHDRHLIEEAVL